MASGPETACIDDAVLAAFIEGRLSEGRAREVEDHLDRCPDCHRVFSDATRLLLDESPELLPAPVAPSRRRGPLSVLLPLAAALVLAVVWGRDALAPSRGPEPDPVALAAEAGDVRALAAAGWSGDPATPSFAPADDGARRAFRAGVLGADLDLARRAGDAERARSLAAASAGLEADGLRDPARRAYGRWVEAARLLAVARDPRLARDPRWREAIERVPPGADDAARRVAAAIGGRLARAPETEADWRRLEEGLRDLVLLM